MQKESARSEDRGVPERRQGSKMRKSKESRAKSTSKPLREVSNGVKSSSSIPNNHHMSMSMSLSVNKNQNTHTNTKSNTTNTPQNEKHDDCLDRLLLVHSDLSSLIHQIDELVGQALKLKATSKKEKEEIESFAHVLTEMQVSLKPWVPRFQKAVSSPSLGSENQPEQLFSNRTVDAENDDMGKVADSPDPTNLGSLVSPSPLVSWRAGCFNEDGRQLFLLTPLPKLKTFSSKLQGSSMSAFESLRTNTNFRPPQSHLVGPGAMNNILLEGIVAERTPVKLSESNVNNVDTMECGFISPEKFSKMDCSMVAMTPCLEVSPPKSCVLLEPISEFTHKKNCVVRAATPFPTGVHNFRSSDDSDSSSSEASEHLILKYPELVGIKQACELGNGRKVVEALPNWFMSPPKTCILMEPPDENLLTSSATNWHLPKTSHAPCWKAKKETEFQGVQTVTKKSCNQGLGDSLTVVERTPVWKEPESTARTGKHPGENTLKKELWTKFEAATTHGLRFNVSALQETANANKEFLDLLEEVSCDETEGT